MFYRYTTCHIGLKNSPFGKGLGRCPDEMNTQIMKINKDGTTLIFLANVAVLLT